MRKLGLVIAALALVAFVSGTAYAGPSAKFAADWADDDVTLAEIVNCTTVCNDSSSDAQIIAAELMATIKVPQGKELLIGVSGEARLLTFTQAKGKNKLGPESTSSEVHLNLAVRIADVDETDVCINALGSLAIPGEITFASRLQELTVDVAGFPDDPLGTVLVALKLDTVAAHHFNFLAIDLESGEYDIWACFSGEAITTVSDDDGLAEALVAIQKRIVTVQEVRAVNSDFVVE